MNNTELNKLVLPATVKIQLQTLSQRVHNNFNDKIVIISGNAGTGKDTIAKLIAKKLYHGNLTRVMGASLIGKKLHTTAPLVHSYIQKALGGVLYIPLAAALSHRSDTVQPYTKRLFNIIPIKQHLLIHNSLGVDTAVKILIAAAEKYKNKLLIVMSDSHNQINNMLIRDECLGLNHCYRITLPNYSEQQLDQIFDVHKGSKVLAWNHKYTPAAVKQIKEAIHEYCNGSLGLPQKYNVRFILTLIDQAAEVCVNRVVDENNYANVTITSKDVDLGLRNFISKYEKISA